MSKKLRRKKINSLKAKRKPDHKITASKEEDYPPTAKEYDTSKESTAKFLSKRNRNKRGIESDASYNESNDEESKQVKGTRRSTSRRSRSVSNESSGDTKPIKNDKRKVKEMSIIEEEKKG